MASQPPDDRPTQPGEVEAFIPRLTSPWRGPTAWQTLRLPLSAVAFLEDYGRGNAFAGLRRLVAEAYRRRGPAAEPGTIGLFARPKRWHCIYCGWRCDDDNDDYVCHACEQIRPFAGGSCTMVGCPRCRQMSLGIALFCEWCGQKFGAGGAAGPAD